MLKKISLIGIFVFSFGIVQSASREIPEIVVEEKPSPSVVRQFGDYPRGNYMEEISMYQNPQPTASSEMWGGREVLAKLAEIIKEGEKFQQYMKINYPALTTILERIEKRDSSLSFWSIIAQKPEDWGPIVAALPPKALVRFECEGFVDVEVTIPMVVSLLNNDKVREAIMLDLSGSFLRGDAKDILMPISNSFSFLSSLFFDYCNLGEGDSRPGNLACLESLLGSAPNLVHLSLAGNQLGDEGAQVIGRALLTNQKLLLLALGDNDIGLEGAYSLGLGLQRNKALSFLNLALNPLTGEGVWILVHLLADNKHLQKMSLVYVEMATPSKNLLLKSANAFNYPKQLILEEPGDSHPEGLKANEKEEQKRRLSSSVS